jgi:hypothetical protein
MRRRGRRVTQWLRRVCGQLWRGTYASSGIEEAERMGLVSRRHEGLRSGVAFRKVKTTSKFKQVTLEKSMTKETQL